MPQVTGGLVEPAHIRVSLPPPASQDPVRARHGEPLGRPGGRIRHGQQWSVAQLAHRRHGYAEVYLYADAGDAVKVTVGAASCSATMWQARSCRLRGFAVLAVGYAGGNARPKTKAGGSRNMHRRSETLKTLKNRARISRQS
jgi:hypothetical protein